MATNRPAALGLLLLSLGGTAYAREAASPAACQTAGQRPPIAAARAAVAAEPADIRASSALADAWSEAGCFGDAVQVLQAADTLSPGNPLLQTRLRVARSLVGEEHFFDNLDRAEMAARLKRDLFRCTSLADLDACAEAGRRAPNDAAVVSARADALLRVDRVAQATAVAAASSAVPVAPAGSLAPAGSAAREAPEVVRPARPAAASGPAAGARIRVANAIPQETALKRYSNEALDDTQSH